MEEQMKKLLLVGVIALGILGCGKSVKAGAQIVLLKMDRKSIMSDIHQRESWLRQGYGNRIAIEKEISNLNNMWKLTNMELKKLGSK
ncbi:MAG: hypothetical protein ACRC23_01970 [Aeromonas jandaei]